MSSGGKVEAHGAAVGTIADSTVDARLTAAEGSVVNSDPRATTTNTIHINVQTPIPVNQSSDHPSNTRDKKNPVDQFIPGSPRNEVLGANDVAERFSTEIELYDYVRTLEAQFRQIKEERDQLKQDVEFLRKKADRAAVLRQENETLRNLNAKGPRDIRVKYEGVIEALKQAHQTEITHQDLATEAEARSYKMEKEEVEDLREENASLIKIRKKLQEDIEVLKWKLEEAERGRDCVQEQDGSSSEEMKLGDELKVLTEQTEKSLKALTKYKEKLTKLEDAHKDDSDPEDGERAIRDCKGKLNNEQKAHDDALKRTKEVQAHIDRLRKVREPPGRALELSGSSSTVLSSTDDQTQDGTSSTEPSGTSTSLTSVTSRRSTPRGNLNADKCPADPP